MDFHPFFIHFPISLFFVSFIIELIYKKIVWIHSNISLFIFVVASILSIPAAYTGNSAEYNAGKIMGIQRLLEAHESVGTLLVISGILFSFMLIFFKLKYPSKSFSFLRKSIFLLMTVMVLYTGFLGGKMVQEFGAGTNIKIEVSN
mgnify:CR=1 FL=1|jgi:uncharacterized membrane protein